MKPSTRLVHRTAQGGVSPPLDRSTTFPYEDGEPGAFFYQRYAHPAGVEAERLLGELEGGQALLFPSGTGAATALVLALLRPGDTIALAEGAYYGTSVLFDLLAAWGVRYAEFDQRGAPPDGVQLVWVEAPSNPLLTFPDLGAAAAHPAPVVVDSTASTPMLLRPLEHSADFVLHSATKYLAGHSDALLGAVVCAKEKDAERLREFRSRTGIVAAPDPAWLLLRGLRTLAVRVERQSASALELAGRLERHPRVERVRYPGLGEGLASRFMQGGFGGLLSFDVAGDARAVEQATRVITNATSLGGVESLIETRARWEGARVPENLLRLAVGLEDVDDLWDDLAQALERA
ncbi:MAG: cystathionine gamma-synthase [Gaiellaceae bacterium]|nr:cystathionine gamma-synthase [Gaiellaceae bacterium]